ncbi:MAG: DUF177 domain-containing protein [Lachnospiraceae bacterium]|nr:DUF177 domain-containing protein [Lachnospiraceae bacterium]
MNIDLTAVLTHMDEHFDVECQLDMDVFQLGTEAYPILNKKPFTLNLSNVMGQKLLICGKTDVTLTVPCDRCLEDVEITLPLTIDYEFQIRQEQIVPDADEEYSFFTEDYRELQPDEMIHDEILVNWPDKVLCRENCKGICPVCGQNLNKKDCGCDRVVLDPRMAKFQDIFNEFKEV